MSQEPSDQERLNEISEARELRLFLKTVGDLVRLQILRRLSQAREMSVTELTRAVRVSQPLLSWHLGVLRRIELVTVRREGRLVWYALNRERLQSYWRQFKAWIKDDEMNSGIGEGEADV
jgi:ArsR family transcriptional regulator